MSARLRRCAEMLPLRLLLVIVGLCSLAGRGAAQEDSLLAYYPLGVGNLWQYVSVGRLGSAVWTVEVVRDTVLGDAKTWKVLADSRESVGAYYERVDSESYNVYHRGEVAGLLDSLRASPGDWVWSVRLRGSAYQEYYEATEETILGVPTIVKHAAARILPDALSYDLAKGIGRSFEEYVTDDPEYPRSTSTATRLCYARIDGAEFGTLLSVERMESVPAAFGLSQNYPNPFNPETIISYSIPTPQFVSIVVYDFLGRVVARLVEEQGFPGEYSVTWNAGGLPGGVYFCRLNSGGVVRTRKLLLLR